MGLGFLLFFLYVKSSLTETSANKFDEMVDQITLNYTCPDNYFVVSMLGRRQSGCNPSSGSGKRFHIACEPTAKLVLHEKKVVPFPRPLMTGDTVTLIATPNADRLWELALVQGNEMVIYLVSRFNFQGYRQMKLDCYSPQAGWHCGADAPTFPYTVDKEFNTTILVGQGDFKIYVDGVEVMTFLNSFPSTPMTEFLVAHDVTIKAIFLK